MARGFAVTLAFAGLMSACGGSPTAPSGPTSAQLAPQETFALPPDAPADAAAPANTTRIRITTLEILRPDGSRANPSTLGRGTLYRFRMWVFCPRGLEGGGFTYRVSGNGGLTNGSLLLAAGYTKVDALDGFITAGTYPYAFEVIRDFVSVATLQVTMSVS